MKDNNKFLFRNITADEKTKELIRKWMKNITLYYSARYRSFKKILEEAGMIGPFNLKHTGKPKSDCFICEFSLKDNRAEVIVHLHFCDGRDNIASILIVDHTNNTQKTFIIKEGKISLSKNENPPA